MSLPGQVDKSAQLPIPLLLEVLALPCPPAPPEPEGWPVEGSGIWLRSTPAMISHPAENAVPAPTIRRATSGAAYLLKKPSMRCFFDTDKPDSQEKTPGHLCGPVDLGTDTPVSKSRLSHLR